MSRVEVSTLPNGMRVVTDTMPQVETVSAGVWIGAGTRHEPAHVNGVAHLLEHMAFKGTHRRSALDIALEIEAVGGHINAYTSREHTAYYAKVLKEHYPLAFDIIADILQNPAFDAGELERERAVILQEIGQSHDTPDDVIFDHYQETAFPDQPLGRPVLGCPEAIGRLGRDSLFEYMGNAYGATGMVLSAAGMIEHEVAVRLAERLFCNLGVLGQDKPDAGIYRGGEFRQDKDLEQVHLVVGFPAPGYLDERHYATSVLTTLFGGGMSSRLFQEIRERRGLAYSVYSFASLYADCGTLSVYAGTGEGEADQVVSAICQEIRRLPDTVDEDEIARSRNQIKAATVMSLESSSARCEQLAQQVLTFGRPIPIAEQVEKIEAVDVAAVRAIADEIFSGAPTVAAIGPLRGLGGYETVRARLRP